MGKRGPKKFERKPEAGKIAETLYAQEERFQHQRRELSMRAYEEIMEIKREARIKSEKLLSEHAEVFAQTLIDVARNGESEAARVSAAKAALEHLSEDQSKSAPIVLINISQNQIDKANRFAKL